MVSPVLKINNLTKIYKDVQAVRDVSFRVQPGEIVGLLGPNGAGKTTTITMVLGVLQPTSGTIEILGQRVDRQQSAEREIMARVSFAASHEHLPGNLSLRENLRVFSLLYGVPDAKARIDQLLREYSLEAFVDTKVGVLSSGEQTRATLAKAMLNKPELLLLDEPTASLDPSTARTVREKIVEYVAKTNAGVLWASHNMHEVEDVCDRVLFFSHGKILLEGDPKKLPGQHGKSDLEELFITVAREPLSLELS